MRALKSSDELNLLAAVVGKEYSFFRETQAIFFKETVLGHPA
jgi:hypothetical protein